MSKLEKMKTDDSKETLDQKSIYFACLLKRIGGLNLKIILLRSLKTLRMYVKSLMKKHDEVAEIKAHFDGHKALDGACLDCKCSTNAKRVRQS